jgi:KUP system potassium uptake protein
VAVLIALFSLQRIGTGSVGKIFGPITLIWFVTLAVLGLIEIAKNPAVLQALNPIHGLKAMQSNGLRGFSVLGLVFLAVTGSEALYADMGHFGKRPIRRAWFFIVFPSLLLNYLGQGALLLRNPAAAENPFYLLAPNWAIIPLVILATVASVIASQALISGAFSLTMQAVQLGYAPRLEIDHTSSVTRGQIYIPQINRMLMFASIGLVIGFGSSSKLAAAYGVAVSLTMLITTSLFLFASQRIWGWSRKKAVAICGVFALIEICFFSANCLKILEGGWFPLLVAAIIYTLMSTWKRGRQLLGSKLRASSLPLRLFLEEVSHSPIHRVTGTAVFLSGNPEGTPMALLHNLKHNKVLHEKVIILTVVTDDVPHVDISERVEVESLKKGFYRVIGHYGFMEDPNVLELLGRCKSEHGLEFKDNQLTFFLSSETIIASSAKHGMAMWREHLFAFMSRNAQRATTFFRLPANRVVELGMQVEI